MRIYSLQKICALELDGKSHIYALEASKHLSGALCWWFLGGPVCAVGPRSHPSPFGHRSVVPIDFPQQPQSLPSAKGDVPGTGKMCHGRCAMGMLFTEVRYISGILSFLCAG